LPELAAAPDIILAADATAKPIEAVTSVYFAVGAYFRLDELGAAARAIELTDHFDRVALDRALMELAAAQRRLSAEVLAGGKQGTDAVQAWVAARGHEVERVRTSVQEIAGRGLTLSRFVVAAGLLSDLVRH
jgi:glutamate dehydrogenase